MHLAPLFCRLLPALVALLLSMPANAAATSANSASAPVKPSFKVCWSIFAGWMPWGYAGQEQIINKWADKYGIQIAVEEVPDYVNSIEQYTAGKFDGCAMTNMDALTIPAATGVDSTALIIGDFSSGADGILLRGQGLNLRDLKGKTILLVENSVSHYLLSRALELAQFSESDVKIQNVSDTEIVQAFLAGQGDAVITWNPLLESIKQQTAVSQVYSSHWIPGEIIDLMVVNTATLAAHPELGKALTGAWFETQRLVGAHNAEGAAVRAKMAAAANTSADDFDAQLKTLRSFYSPRAALNFANSDKLPLLMQRVVNFADAQQLLGAQGSGLQQLGISFSDGRVLGNPAQIKLRFDPTYLQQASNGQL
ncbi:MAG: NitT/TauT family transport system substrate-binding protein [Pseudomonas sp.]|jgi:NitT/TauT family transport system substrate-binding protein